MNSSTKAMSLLSGPQIGSIQPRNNARDPSKSSMNGWRQKSGRGYKQIPDFAEDFFWRLLRMVEPGGIEPPTS
jgi:hypothetical protein